MFGKGSMKFDTNAFAQRVFRPVENVVWDVMTGKVGIVVNDSIATIDGEGEDAQLTLNLFTDFGMAIPAFAQSTKISDVKVGDVVFTSKSSKPAWVVERIEKKVADGEAVALDAARFKLMSTEGTTHMWKAPKVSILGMADDGVMVLRSLTSLLPGGADGLGDMQSSMMQIMQMKALMGDDSEMDLSAIIPFMLMSGGKMDASGGNMMQTMMIMPMLQKMMGDGSGFDMASMMPLMMMSGGTGGFNPMMFMMMQQMGKGTGKTNNGGKPTFR